MLEGSWVCLGLAALQVVGMIVTRDSTFQLTSSMFIAAGYICRAVENK